MKIYKLANEKVRVEFDVSIDKKTGQITVEMKEGLCKFKMGKSKISLSEILNLLVLGHMGADLSTVKQRLNEYGMQVEGIEAPPHPITPMVNPTAPKKQPVQEEEEEPAKQKARLGNV